MEVVQTVINALVVAAVGLALARMGHHLRTELKGDIARVEAALAVFRTEFKADIAELRTEMREMRSELRAEIGEVRSDLTRVALAIGADPRPGRQ